jgi:hypothetical protein
MTEAEWLTGQDLLAMLVFLMRRASKRKEILYSVACCRLIWHMIADDRSRSAVLVAERFADGRATSEELAAAGEEAEVIWSKNERDEAALVCYQLCVSQIFVANAVSGSTIRAAWRSRRGETGEDEPPFLVRLNEYPVVERVHSCYRAEELECCKLLREIFGNPFRPLPPIKGKRAWKAQRNQWLAWQDAAIPRMAQTVYEERAFDRLPLLADALEDAGCCERALLEHLREPGPHVRGCWGLDLLLNKQ